ncbi:MAG: peptidoglycan DD-metalloendopeptidase family protein [Acidimicrobiales bacterium]
MTTNRTIRHRAAAILLSGGLATAVFAAPAPALPARPGAPAQEGGSSQLKAEYDEVIGEEAELLDQLAEAQAASKDAADELADLQSRTKQAQVDLVNAQLALQDAEADLGRRLAAREQAEARVAVARDRLRRQIVASYVAGGEDDGLLEAFLGAEDGDQVGQALAYGRAVSGTTETLVVELDEARAAEARAAKLARQARQGARDSRDDIADAATFLSTAAQQQQQLVQDLNVKVLVEAQALREVQGRKAVVEGRINSMNTASDGVAMILADRQRDQPDWFPGAVAPISTPVPGVQIGSPYGMRHHPILGIDRLHAGVDLGGGTGTEIHAAAAGVVVVAEERGGYGNTVVIDHGGSLGTLYGHNSRLLVRVGDTVEYGQVIALMGSTGLSTGPHSHFETRVKGLPIDPRSVISDFGEDVDYDAVLEGFGGN